MKSMSVSKLRVIPGLVVVGLLFVSIGDSSFAAISATSTSYQYDDAGRLKMVVVDPSQLSTNNVATYSYDSDGNVLTVSRSTSTGLNVLSYSPLRGVGGNQVIIYGTGFSSTPSSNTVKFNGTAATVAASTDTEIITSVPTGATTGPISVKVGTTTKTGTQTFTVGPNAPPPTVTGFSPTIAAPGDALNVTGTHFDTQSINDLALLGKTLMAVSGSTSTSLTTTVPGSTGTGHVTVENSDGSATSSGFLFVPPAGHTVADVAVTGTATLGTASLVNFTSAGKIGLLAFDGTAGQRVSVNLVAPSGGSSLQLIAHLLGPDGSSIEDGIPSGSGTSFLDTVTLPSDGTYTVEVEGINGTTGGTNVTVYNVNDINQAITPTSSGVAKTVTLNVPGMNATYTFTGSQNNRFSFVFSNISGTTPVTVTDPSGNTVVSGTVYSFGTYLETGYLTNPTTGTYSIKFDPVGAAANGSFTMTAYKVPADTSKAITIGGAAVTVSNSTPGQNMLATFSTTTASKKVTLTMSSVTGLTSGTVSFIDSNGTVYGGAQGWGISGGSFNATLGAAGSYKILVDPAGGGVGSVHLQLANGTFALAPSPPPTRLAIKRPAPPPTFKLVGLDEWQPDPAIMWNWKAASATSPYQSYPLPAAARGVTAVAGRVLTVAGRPLLGVSLSIGKHVTRTDRDGRFVLRRVPSGHQVLLIDGSTATNTSESFGVFEDGVDLVNGKTNRLPYTTWMTALDVKHEVHFTYPITHTLTITNPQIPGLEVKIPAGSVLTNDAGKRVTELGITPISVNRPPFPLPVGVDVPIYFTVQPGSTYISKGARIIYPNYTHVPPGTRGVFWNYDPDHRGWYVYGHGTVTPNGKQVIPDPGVRVWEFTGAMWNPLDHLGPIWDASKTCGTRQPATPSIRPPAF